MDDNNLGEQFQGISVTAAWYPRHLISAHMEQEGDELRFKRLWSSLCDPDFFLLKGDWSLQAAFSKVISNPRNRNSGLGLALGGGGSHSDHGGF